MPTDARWFVDEVAASGTGPGYDLDLRPIAEGRLHLAQAGCGAQWALDLIDGSVVLDSRFCDGEFRRVAMGFVAWYKAWLDNATRGGGPYARWSHSLDAAFEVLVQAAGANGVDKLPKLGLEVMPHSPEDKLVGSYHGCESVYAHYGVSNTALVMKERSPNKLAESGREERTTRVEIIRRMGSRSDHRFPGKVVLVSTRPACWRSWAGSTNFKEGGFAGWLD